jgi:hypothetical protein
MKSCSVSKTYQLFFRLFQFPVLNNMGLESSIQWDQLECPCGDVADKHTRACKIRAKHKRDDHGVSTKVSMGAVGALSTLPFVYPYDVHLDDGTFRIMGSELATLDPGQAISSTICTRTGGETPRGAYQGCLKRDSSLRLWLQCSVCCVCHHYRPIRMQLRSLGACMGVCKRSALDGMALYICVPCGLG